MTEEHPSPQPIDPTQPVPPRRLLRGSEQLSGMVGHRLLVGISYVDDAGNVTGRQQFCGRVLDVADGVVVVERAGASEPAVLPADVAAFRRAPSGQYRLAASGEVVVDPDFITTWQVQAPPG
jgi:hypothetical protein